MAFPKIATLDELDPAVEAALAKLFQETHGWPMVVERRDDHVTIRYGNPHTAPLCADYTKIWLKGALAAIDLEVVGDLVYADDGTRGRLGRSWLDGHDVRWYVFTPLEANDHPRVLANGEFGDTPPPEHTPTRRSASVRDLTPSELVRELTLGVQMESSGALATRLSHDDSLLSAIRAMVASLRAHDLIPFDSRTPAKEF